MAETKNDKSRPMNKYKKLLLICCFLKVRMLKKVITIARPTTSSPNLNPPIYNPLKVLPKIVIKTI